MLVVVRYLEVWRYFLEGTTIKRVYVLKDDKLRAEIVRLYHDMLVGGHREQ